MVRAPSAVFDATVPALALNIGDYPFHQGSLGIIRSLGRLGVPTYVVQRGRFMPAGTSRYLAGQFLWDSRGEDVNRFLDGMAAIGRCLGRPAILIPTDDFSAILVAEHALALSLWFIAARQPPALPRTLANKRELYHLCGRLGLPCARTYFPGSRDELLTVIERMSFPVILKGTEPWLLPKGVKGTAVVATPGELLSLYENFWATPQATTLIVQEMIPDEVGEDWIVHGYCGESSECALLFTGVKLRSYPAFAGPTTLARCIRNDALRQQAAALFTAIGYRGIMDLDYRLDRRDGRYKLLDFNPRVGAQFRLFEDDAGIDVVRALHLDLTGRRIPTGSQIEGRGFIVEISDALASLTYYRNGRLAPGDWLRSLRGVAERAWFAADDVRPFLLMCLWMFCRACSRAFGIQRRQASREKSPRFVRRHRWRGVGTGVPRRREFSLAGTDRRAAGPHGEAGARCPSAGGDSTPGHDGFD